MKLADLISGLSVRDIHADMELDVTGVSYDSRKTSEGDLFVAVRGYDTDGHKFIGAAVRAGAVCILCEEKPEEDVPYVLTDNTRRGLAVVSAAWFKHPAAELKIIGVTGTNGKTTTTTLIKGIIEHITGDKVGLIGTNNNLIGDKAVGTERTTPESFELQALFRRMADEGCKWVVMEVSSHALYLDRVYGVRYTVGVFTNLTQDHLDFHKTMENYLKAKALLFKQCEKGAVNLDDVYAKEIISEAECPIMTFSESKDTADLVAKRVKLSAEKVEFCALTIGKLEKIELNIPARFTVCNALAAISAGLLLGFELEKIAEALREAKGVKGRMEVVPTGCAYTVIIDYAHTPDALEKIITTCRELTAGRIITLFGCGGDRDATKRPIMGEIAVRLSDFAVITSDNPRTEVPRAIIDDILRGVDAPKERYTVIEDRREAIGWALNFAQKSDIIILAGKGHETYQIIGKEKHHFDEREVVGDFLSGADAKKN